MLVQEDPSLIVRASFLLFFFLFKEKEEAKVQELRDSAEQDCWGKACLALLTLSHTSGTSS